MIILPTWVLILGTSIVFLLAIVLGVYFGVCLTCVSISTMACKKLNDSEYKVFESLMIKCGELKNSRWAKKEP